MTFAQRVCVWFVLSMIVFFIGESIWIMLTIPK